MDPEGERDFNADSVNLGFDFFSQPPSFPVAAASSSSGHGRGPHRGDTGVDGLDLNSQALNLTDDMSYLDLLRSSSVSLIGEGDHTGAGHGAGRGASRAAGRGASHAAGCGASHAAGRGRGRGASRGSGRGTGGGRCTGREMAAPTGIVVDVARGHGRGTQSPHPGITAPQQFRPPRPSRAQSNTHVQTPSIADAAFPGGLHEPGTSTWNQSPYNEEPDDVQEIDALVRPLLFASVLLDCIGFPTCSSCLMHCIFNPLLLVH